MTTTTRGCNVFDVATPFGKATITFYLSDYRGEYDTLKADFRFDELIVNGIAHDGYVHLSLYGVDPVYFRYEGNYLHRADWKAVTENAGGKIRDYARNLATTMLTDPDKQVALRAAMQTKAERANRLVEDVEKLRAEIIAKVAEREALDAECVVLKGQIDWSKG